MVNQPIMQKPSSNRLNQLWRIVVTAFGFTLFGLGGLIILSTLWFSLLRLFVWNKNHRSILAQQSISLSFKFFLWVMKVLGVMNYQFNGLAQLQQDESCLVVANHPSLLDFVLLASVMPRCDCMVKESLLNNIFLGGVIKAAGYIPNSEASKMLPHCQETLVTNGRILIFPEGTRSVPGKPITLQRGAANIALRCQANIRIIHIECNPPTLVKNQKWNHVPPTKPFFNITVGEKIAINDFSDNNNTVSARQLTRYLALKLSSSNNTNKKIIKEKTMNQLHDEIKQLIIDVLNLEEIAPGDIETDAPLFGDGLGLDSIDALELGLAIKNRYGIVLSAESEETKQVFYSVKTLADFILSQQ